EGGVACFGTRSPTHAVALLAVVGAEAWLASADDATQEELLAGRAQFLNAQTTPFQVLVRPSPSTSMGTCAGCRREQPCCPRRCERSPWTTSSFCRRWPTSAPCSSATATWSCPTSEPRFQQFHCGAGCGAGSGVWQVAVAIPSPSW